MPLDTPFTLHRPLATPVPLVCDSPHSGTDYPADYDHAVPRALLRRGEDTHVDALWAAVPSVGGSLLAAHFPRTYIDCNRTEDDLDADLLDGPWPQPLNPGDTFYCQALNFILPNSLPNGQNNFGLITSNGLKSRFDLQ